MTLVLGLLTAGVLLFVALVLPVLAFVRGARHSRRLDDLERQVNAVAAGLRELRQPLAPWDAPEAVATPPGPGGTAVEPTFPTASTAPPRVSPASGLSLEARIGSRWMLYVGIAAILLGASYFIRFAFDNEWVGPGTRVSLGVLLGLGMAEGGRRLAAHGFRSYGQVVAGGGFGVVYLSVYTAYHYYELVGAPTAFALMLANSVLAAFLANRQRSQPLALAAVFGGFATPFLASTGRDAQVTLFTYVALVVAATVYFARRRDWMWLNLASFVLTWVTIGIWADTYYTPGKWIPTQIFLVLFTAMFLHVLRETLRAPAAHSPASRLLSAALAAGPLLFHAASLLNLSRQPAALLVYFIAVTVAGVIASDVSRWHWIRFVVWLAVAAPFLAWIDQFPARAWLGPGIVGAAAIYGLHLLSQLRLVGHGPGPRLADVLLIHGNGLWLYWALVALLDPHAVVWMDRIAWILALWNLGLATRARTINVELALHYLALAATFVAIAVAVTFDGPWVTAGWAVEGAALLWIGLRVRRDWIRLAGGLLLTVAVVRLGIDLLGPARAGAFVLLNARAAAAVAVIGLLYLTALAHRRPGAPGPADGRLVAALIVSANVLTLLLVTAEITAAYQMQQWRSAEAGGVVARLELARQAALSATWAAYGLALVAVGIGRRYAPLRYLAIAVLTVAIGKVFLIDLARLDRLYRILSVIALGVVLLAASYLYQRFTTDAKPAPEDQPSPSG
jgi:uncharacterized membrane protein